MAAVIWGFAGLIVGAVVSAIGWRYDGRTDAQRYADSKKALAAAIGVPGLFDRRP